MASDHAYTSPESIYHDPPVNVVDSKWYAPSSLAYDEPYMTPYPSSTMESSTWNPLAKSALLGIDMAPYVFSNAAFHHASAPNRPRSSPSSFGPAPDSIQWPTPNALGIHFQPEVAAAPATVPATSHGFEPRPSRHQFSVSSTPELRQPRPLRPYHSIAPSPAGTSTTAPATKRRMTDDDEAFLGAEVSSRVGTPKRRKRASSVNSTDLSEDDRFLVQLKEDESLPWKEIAARFIADKGKTLQVAALQMRYKRLRERSRAWEDRDLNALRLAHEYWEECKWDIISQKMTEFSNTERWPPRYCVRKWQEIGTISANIKPFPATTAGITPAVTSYLASPVEAPLHFGFKPA